MLLVPAPQGKLCLTGSALSHAHFPLILERKVELPGTPRTHRLMQLSQCTLGLVLPPAPPYTFTALSDWHLQGRLSLSVTAAQGDLGLLILQLLLPPMLELQCFGTVGSTQGSLGKHCFELHSQATVLFLSRLHCTLASVRVTKRSVAVHWHSRIRVSLVGQRPEPLMDKRSCSEIVTCLL